MRFIVGTVGLVGLVGLAFGASPAPASARYFDSASAAVLSLVQKKPRVVAFGEYHQVKGRSAAPSALKHFSDEILDALAPRSAELIAETWLPQGRCGKTEEVAVAKVEETIKRPEATESELVTMIKRAKAGGVQPRILNLSCAEYEQIQPKDGPTDYVALLRIITEQLKKNIDAARQRIAKAGKPAADKMVLVYGGALHNDLFPQQELETFSFAKTVQKETGGRYVEVDLYVPEYIESDEKLRAEAWFVAWQRAEPAHAQQIAVISRSPSSHIVIFPRTAAVKPAE